MTLTFPTRVIREVWHTGTLDPADKRPGSYEGAGLSVSRHPYAWERIARAQIRGTRHRLTCRDGIFLNALRMTRAQIAAIQAWALDRGYVRLGTVYEVRWNDDEFECDRAMSFTSLRAARREAQGRTLHRCEGLIARAPLKRRILANEGVVSVVRDLAPVYAEDVLDLDGTWWFDPLDVLTLTAPCGVIAPSRLGRWRIQPAAPGRADPTSHRKAA